MADAFPSSHEDEDIQCELRPEVKVIGRNKSKLVTDLDPSILRVYLSDCLTKDDESRIEAKQCSQGQIRAADLFLHLVSFKYIIMFLAFFCQIKMKLAFQPYVLILMCSVSQISFDITVFIKHLMLGSAWG